MALALEWFQLNGASPGTETDGVTTFNYGSTDAANSTASIVAGTASYEHVVGIKCVTPATNSLGNFTVWWNATRVEDASTNPTPITMNFGIVAKSAYTAPVATASTIAVTNTQTATSSGTGVAFAGPANTANALSTQIIYTQMLTTTIAVGGACVFPTPWTTAQYLYS